MMNFNSGVDLSKLYVPGAAIDDPPGSSARAWRTRRLKVPAREPRDAVLKVIRPTRMDAGTYKQFVDEVEALYELRDNPHVIDMYDWGFISSEHLPRSLREADDAAVSSNEKIISLREEGVDVFATMIDEARQNNWRPYIVLELMRIECSMYALVKRNQTAGEHASQRLTTHDVLEMCDQYIGLLKQIHHLPRPIFYYDTKPAHTYWYGRERLLRIIDWNVIKRLNSDDHPEWPLRAKKDIALMFFDSIFPASTGVYPPDGSSGWEGFAQKRPRPPLNYGPLEREIQRELKQLLEKGLSEDAFQSLDEVATSSIVRRLASKIGRKGFAGKSLHINRERQDAHQAAIKGLTALREMDDALSRALKHFEEVKRLNRIDRDARWLEKETQKLKTLLDKARFIHG